MSSLVRTALVLGALFGAVPATLAGSNPATQILPQPSTPALQEAPAAVTAPAVTDAAKGRSRRDLRAARRESHRQAALERRAAKLALRAVKTSPAVAKASPGEMEAGLTSAPKGVEKPVPTPTDSTAGTASPREIGAPTLSDLVAKHALANGVPVSLAKAVVQIESRGNPHAANRGALGLMQIKYTTARAAGFSGVAAGLFVAETNLRFGMKVLGDAYRSSGGDVCGALMRYQSGHLATHPNRANRAYCSRARAIMAGA